ncbi:helix-turn-helix domain-containing protein [Tropicibacter naphthalenivorans]|uniref:HTH cro/C1-type domain-containing protein n=1 Tax=Tropicibacter naphthalenivorans TaxID=441103 RepID=A0A0P1GQW8_9RHOB|nr:helix-turn-helix transcriptional regulator [Tropicibacter naphthalenivorans]CUH77598.1 hypothetical protein TRN7648_01559 [Tropicibacter naphthalenivorans]SMC55970.1 Cro/C1-type HTH DNA-binding domain-containing protein [Tropicibacter naphthalenivorans]
MAPTEKKTTLSHRPTPSELRSMLGANLRQLAQQAASVSALCRDLGINRTQFNRYLAGESFPRPDVLHRICTHFKVDARILLEPVEEIAPVQTRGFQNPALADFLGPLALPLTEAEMPSGFYRFSRRSYMDETKCVQGLLYVFRANDDVLIKGFEAKDAMATQGLKSSLANREFRGNVMRQDDGIGFFVSRRGATTFTFNFLARVPAFENNYWQGYTARPTRENGGGRLFERLVYEYLGRDPARILPAARVAGLCDPSELPPFHAQLLKLGQPIA